MIVCQLLYCWLLIVKMSCRKGHQAMSVIHDSGIIFATLNLSLAAQWWQSCITKIYDMRHLCVAITQGYHCRDLSFDGASLWHASCPPPAPHCSKDKGWCSYGLCSRINCSTILTPNATEYLPENTEQHSCCPCSQVSQCSWDVHKLCDMSRFLFGRSLPRQN